LVWLRLPIFVAMILGAAATALSAIAIDRTLYRRLRRTAPVILLISSFGVALILRSLVQLVWGPDNHVYKAGIQMPFVIGGLRIKPDQLTIVIGAVVLMVALHLFLRRTKTGKAMRAMADNVDLARITGIDTERVVLWTWVIGAALAAAAGTFLAMDTRLNPLVGWRILLDIFAAAILGGIGSVYGAIVGGLVIGIAEEMSTLFIAPPYKAAVAFAILVVMLIVRPSGLFAGR
jgi:branched-chain amino acid transport system permease protein/neutral amino acid transport system permease protein